jgi:hypothetical protein
MEKNFASSTLLLLVLATPGYFFLLTFHAGRFNKEVLPKECQAWSCGETYPVAYHLKCRGGHFANFGIWEDEFLAVSRKEKIPASVNEDLDKLVEQFAIKFLKARGEMLQRHGGPECQARREVSKMWAGRSEDDVSDDAFH